MRKKSYLTLAEDLCLGEEPEKKTLQKGIDRNLNTFVSGVDGGFSMTSTKIDGKFDIQDNKTFELTVLAKYVSPIVVGTDCNQVQMTVHGIMVSMYQTNPNATGQPPTTGKPPRANQVHPINHD